MTKAIFSAWAVLAGAYLSSAANTYAGGTTINGGVLSIANDFNLGDLNGAGVTINAGTLLAAADVTTNRPITLGHTASGCHPRSAPPTAGPRIPPTLQDIEPSAK